MGTTTTLIDAREVVNGGIVKNSPSSNRFDSALLSPYVQVMEIEYLKSIICDDFYFDLIAEKAGNVSNYNPKPNCPVVEAFPSNAIYENLWKEYLLPYLSFCLIHKSLPFINFKISSNGILETFTEYANNTGEKGFQIMRDEIKGTIDVLRENLKKHLCQNKDLYTLFCDECYCNEYDKHDDECDCHCDACKNGYHCNTKHCYKRKTVAPDLGIVFY